MRNNKALMTIFAIAFVDLFGFGLILPLLPFIGEKYGANAFEIGLLASAYSFFQFIASPILGRLSDRYGRKKMLIISQAGSAIGFLLLAFAHSLPLLFLSRIIDGITGGNISIAQAYIADVTTKENRARGMGLIGAAFGLGFIFGPSIGGLLSRFGFAYPAYFAAAVSALTVVLTTIFLKEKVVVDRAVKSKHTRFSLDEFILVLKKYPIGLLIVVFFLLNLAFSLFQGVFALWSQDTMGLGPTENGWLFAFIGILAVITQLQVLPFLLKRFNERILMKAGFILLFIGLISIVFATEFYMLFISTFFISIGNALTNPSLQAIASENVPKEEYGETLGMLQASGSLGRIIGPAAGGELYLVGGKNMPFYLSAGTMVAVAALLSKKLK